MELLQNGTKGAVAYLENTYESYSNNSYVLAIVAYAFYKARSSELENVLKLLNERAIMKGTLPNNYFEDKLFFKFKQISKIKNLFCTYNF